MEGPELFHFGHNSIQAFGAVDHHETLWAELSEHDIAEQIVIMVSWILEWWVA
jgi:hypothetical protein